MTDTFDRRWLVSFAILIACAWSCVCAAQTSHSPLPVSKKSISGQAPKSAPYDHAVAADIHAVAESTQAVAVALHSIAESTQILADASKDASQSLHSHFTWDKALAPIISAIAIILSLITLSYTRNKDSKARAQSILDDYWLRKIVSPLAIEPLVKWIVEDLIPTLPEDCGSSQFSQTAVDGYAALHQQQKIARVHNLIALRQLDSALHDRALTALDAIEDSVVDYCYANREGPDANGIVEFSKSKLAADIEFQLNVFFTSVRDFQVNLGDSATKQPSRLRRFVNKLLFVK